MMRLAVVVRQLLSLEDNIKIFQKNMFTYSHCNVKLNVGSLLISRLTSNYAHYRLFGYCAILVLHGGNSIAMTLALRGDIMKDSEIATFSSLQWAYITIWNVLFQLIYASLGILCELSTVLEIKEHAVTKYLKAYRQVLFVSIILPLAFVIILLFWPMYVYDREIVFPTFIDKVISQGSNHIMHTAIIPIVLWEFVYLPKSKPKSHQLHLAHTFGCFVYYLYVLFSTYARRGIWPYPILKLVYGTIYFPMIFIGIGITLLIFVYGQWYIDAILWGTDVKTKKKGKLE